LLLGIVHGDRPYRIKRVSSDSPTLPLSKVGNEVYNSQWP
jgi:hypothetical protein